MKTRRDFIKTSAMAGAGIAAANSAFGTPLFNLDKGNPRVGIIGVGERGRSLLGLLLNRDDVDVVTICDIEPITLGKAQEQFIDKGKAEPQVFTGDDHAYRKLLDLKDLDGVLICTPWRWHFEMAIDAMNDGKYVGLEVCGAQTIQQCWDLVNTHEKTGSHLYFMENVCYRRDIMAVLNMVRQDLFGELIHLEGGYQHDLRHVKFNDGKSAYGKGVEFGENGYSESAWRTQHSVDRNGELYPTHGFGPVAKMIDLDAGNRCLHLTSTASKARGLHNYVVEHGGKDHANAKVDFKLGDVVTTVIQTANGETITLNHDTNLPRPYSLGFRVQGEKGIWMDINNSIYVEGKSPSHRWELDNAYMKEYDHPLWKKYQGLAAGAGHGGMDWFVINAFVECVKTNAPAPIDVYDGATMSVITPLSEKSIAAGSAPQEFPDFTKGKWKERKNTFALDETY